MDKNFTANKPELNKLTPFYFKKIKGKYLLTNDGGDFLFLSEKEFRDFVVGKFTAQKKEELEAKNFLISGMENLIKKYRSRKDFLFSSGPDLHIVVVTLRCNHKCVYCHASAQDVAAKQFDMSLETADKVLDLIFQTSSRFIAIEFQGGEPLLNWPVVKRLVEGAHERNKKAKKNLEIRLVSNFSLMTEEKFRYLLENKVSMCVSLDGPRPLHNKNRPLALGGDSHFFAAKWVRKFYSLYPKLKKSGYIFKMGTSVTISRDSLSQTREIVDEHIKLGINNFYLRPLNPFGFSLKHWRKIGYPIAKYIKFYKKALDHIIKLNLEGKKVREKMALTFLVKILSDRDPNHLDFRCPCGAGIGQLAYNWNGDIYTCDEGRMLSVMGDENFKVGSVENTYPQIVGHPVVRTMCSASCLDALAGCADCAFNPYCGVCPIYNYSKQGNIFGQMPTNERCILNQAILVYLLQKLEDKKTEPILREWVDEWEQKFIYGPR